MNNINKKLIEMCKQGIKGSHEKQMKVFMKNKYNRKMYEKAVKLARF